MKNSYEGVGLVTFFKLLMSLLLIPCRSLRALSLHGL